MTSERYWYIRMRQGSSGQDYAEELWDNDSVGILFGSWTMEDLPDSEDSAKVVLDSDEFEEKLPPSPSKWDSWKNQIRSFLYDLSPGDRVVTVFGNTVHLATVGTEVFTNPEERPKGEFFKCRAIKDKKSFPLPELPAVYRLVQNTGQRTIQRIRKFDHLIEHLDSVSSGDTSSVRKRFRDASTEEFLSYLSAKGWEVVCGEYLRNQIGYKPSVLLPGGTVASIDHAGVDGKGIPVLAQCKNDDRPRSRQEVVRWVNRENTDRNRLFYFARSGIEPDKPVPDCEIVGEEEISKWLDANPEYLKSLQSA